MRIHKESDEKVENDAKEVSRKSDISGEVKFSSNSKTVMEERSNKQVFGRTSRRVEDNGEVRINGEVIQISSVDNGEVGINGEVSQISSVMVERSNKQVFDRISRENKNSSKVKVNGVDHEERSNKQVFGRISREDKNSSKVKVNSVDHESISCDVSSAESIPNSYGKKIETIKETIARLYPDQETPLLSELIAECCSTTDQMYGITEAIDYGKDFVWPEGICDRDLNRAIDSNFSVERMAAERHQVERSSRLSQARVKAVVPPSDPDYKLLMDLVDGIRLFRDDSFVPTASPPPMRKLYRQVKGAVNKKILELWEEELVFILPKTGCSQLNLHYTPIHWTTKVGKKGGRILFDSSDDKHGQCLNSERVKELVETYYGTIEHPSIQDMVTSITEFVKRKGCDLADIVLWKADLQGAFTLLSFRPEDVQYLACELTDDLVMIYHTGLFGWTGTPFAFQVVTRVLSRVINLRIDGQVVMYVDDIGGVSLKCKVEQDMRICKEVCEGLLGPKAMAEDKWECSRRIDFIGWSIDLDKQRVSIARRNFLKTLYGFFSVDETKAIPMREIERLASWSSRYQSVIRLARPLTTVLYSQIAGLSNRNMCKLLTDEGKEVINIWRMLLCLSNFNEEFFCRSFSSFQQSQPVAIIGYDSSLTGLGLSIQMCEKDIKYGRMSFPFSLVRRPGYQNVAEFMAVVIGISWVIKQGVKGIGVKLVGDNTTSLKWGTTERFKGTYGLRSAIVYTLLGVQYDVWVEEAEHIKGELNVTHDRLSRGESVVDLGFSLDKDMMLESDPELCSLLNLMNPTLSLSHPSSLCNLWCSIAQLSLLPDNSANC